MTPIDVRLAPTSGAKAEIFLAAASPAEIVDKLNEAINAGLADPTIKARLADLGGVPMPMSPAEFGKFIVDEIERWGKVVKFSGAKPE